MRAAESTAGVFARIRILNTHPFTGSRTFLVVLSHPSGATLGAISKATVTIYGDEQPGKVSLSSAAYSARQNAGNLTITVARTVNDGDNASVGYATANGSAVAGKDYTAAAGTLSWINGDGSSKTFVIPISNAAPFSGSKTLSVALTGAKGTSIGTASATVTIAGDGTTAPPPTVTIPAVPTGLAATAGDAQVSLRWSASSGASSYHVKRATTSGGPYTQIGAPVSAGYTDTAVANGTTYHYVVSALDSAGESANSGQVNAVPAALASSATANACGLQLGTTPVIFCETFDAPAGLAGTRTGDLNPNVWGVSRGVS